MTHDRLVIHALADDELSAEERKNAEDHLAGCPQCRAEHKAVDSLKTVVQTRLEPVETQAAWARCLKRLDEVDRSKNVQAFVTRYAWGFCSLFLVIILGAATWNHMLGRHSVQTSEVAQMASGLIPMPGPRSQDPRQLGQWMSKTVGGSVSMNLRPHMMQILGGASGLRDGHRILRLDIRDRLGRMYLFVISDAQAVDGLERLDSSPNYCVGKMGRMNCVAWTDGGNALLIMGDRAISDLCAVAEDIAVK